jgi:imidazolonepropionase-like amidohydrolase
MRTVRLPRVSWECTAPKHRAPPPNRDDDDEADVDTSIDCGGRVLMPGMIDSHVHVTASSANLRMPASMPPSLVFARSVPILEGMLSRGFTTVRDCGGADHGLAAAVAEGTLKVGGCTSRMLTRSLEAPGYPTLEPEM